jgi:hypothetical protein
MNRMKFKYYKLLLGVLFLASCSKELKVEKAPDLEITTESSTYKAGVPVKFKFTGDADIVSFFSGEESKEYAFKDGKIIDVAGAGAEVSFTSAVSGVSATAQNNHLSVWTSTDFDGNYDFASVQKATWTQQSFVINGTTATFVASGVKDISSLITSPDKPFYIAFRYITKPQLINGFARQHWIQTFQVKSKAALPAGVTKPLILADQLTAGFTIVNQFPVDAPSRSSKTSTRLTMQGNVYKDPANAIYDPLNPIYDPNNPVYVPGNPLFDPTRKIPTFVPYDFTSPFNDPEAEHWAVSGAIYTNKVDLGADRPVAVKGVSDGRITEFSYTYAATGNYKAVFVTSNNSVDETKKAVKEVALTITP